MKIKKNPQLFRNFYYNNAEIMRTLSQQSVRHL